MQQNTVEKISECSVQPRNFKRFWSSLVQRYVVRVSSARSRSIIVMTHFGVNF